MKRWIDRKFPTMKYRKLHYVVKIWLGFCIFLLMSAVFNVMLMRNSGTVGVITADVEGKINQPSRKSGNTANRLKSYFGFLGYDSLSIGSDDAWENAATVEPSELATPEDTSSTEEHIEEDVSEDSDEDDAATAVPTLLTTGANSLDSTKLHSPKYKDKVDLFSVNELVFEENFFQNCRSPEAGVAWPFHDEKKDPPSSAVASILNPSLHCGFGLGGTGFVEYFQDTVKGKLIQPILDQEGCELAVFGAAFGSSYINWMKHEFKKDIEQQVVKPKRIINKHGRCFFMFVYPKDSRRGVGGKPQKVGHYWLIPLRPERMPYKNSRRNAKLLKYAGNMLFLNDDSSGSNGPVSPKAIIWQDAKFFKDGSGFIYSVPRDYTTVLDGLLDGDGSNSRLPCVTFMGLPVSTATYKDPVYTKMSIGLAVSSYTRPKYIDHCRTIIDALKKRPGVTDSRDALIGQCVNYMAYVNEHKNETKSPIEDEETDSLHFGMIDTAFVVWNEATETCREFNAILRCTMFDQLHCHSDRDQVLFPMVVNRFLAPGSNSALGSNSTFSENPGDRYRLRATYFNNWTKKKSYVDKDWKPHAHDLDFVDQKAVLPLKDPDREKVFVRIQQTGCHWYYYMDQMNQPLGERQCGHKIWINDNHYETEPTLSQEKQITAWARPLSSKAIVFPKKATADSLAIERGNRDIIEAPFAADFLRCTSPEFDKVPYTFRESKPNDSNTTLSCGTSDNNHSPRHQMLRKEIDPVLKKLSNDKMCSDMVVFGQVLEKGFLNVISSLIEEKENENYSKRTKEMLKNHGHCFFLFVTKKDLEEYKKERSEKFKEADVVSLAHFWLIPIPGETLPYASMRRNSKFLKYSAQFLFPHAKNIVYQDVVLFAPQFINRQPINYSKLYKPSELSNVDEFEYSEKKPCVTLYSLPRNKATIGNTGIEREDLLFPGHCKHIINSMEKLTPGGKKTGDSKDTAAASSLIQQCDAYIQFVYKREIEMDFLNQALADTNFISWNESDEFCRDFNAELRCTILDQLHCHTDRDRLAFVFALYVNQMGHGSTTEYSSGHRHHKRDPVDHRFLKYMHNFHIYRNVEAPLANKTMTVQKRDVVKLLRSGAHWTRKSLGV